MANARKLRSNKVGTLVGSRRNRTMLELLGFIAVAYLVIKVIGGVIVGRRERRRYDEGAAESCLRYSDFLHERVQSASAGAADDDCDDSFSHGPKSVPQFDDGHEKYLQQDNLTQVLIVNTPKLYDGEKMARCIDDLSGKLPFSPNHPNNLFFTCVFIIGYSVWMAIHKNNCYGEDHLKTIEYRTCKCVMDSGELFDIMYDLYIDTHGQRCCSFPTIGKELAMRTVKKYINDYEGLYAVNS